jgi:hypothetical protein
MFDKMYEKDREALFSMMKLLNRLKVTSTQLMKVYWWNNANAKDGCKLLGFE